MEKNTRTKNILLVVLLIAVLTLSISYAALQQSLTINSSAVIGGKSTNWNVKFTAASCHGTGYGTVETPFSTTETTALSGLVAKLRAPGDTVVCDLTISNLGTLNADLSSFTLQQGDLTITDSQNNTNQGNGPYSADVTAANGLVTTTLVYATDDGITAARGLAPKSAGTGNDLIKAADTNHPEYVTQRKLTLTFTLDPNATIATMPTNDVTISGYNVVFLYNQI